ncbi:SPOR domain-containing protein [Aquabacterium sp.]|uniref:SPOR domain-containing protein n=1 Tax=Aquabacterium sp. TaxID=1872578 RepID=UPI0025C4F5C3|nr:SPOR domain-containing protein [Aquabacterium sp.]
MKSQRGGFFLGMIVGMLAGLALALGVALYIAKVPLPFIDKVPQRTAEQDAAEAEKNKNWDPNNPLYGKNPAKPRPVQVESAPAPGAESASVPTASPAGSAPAAKASASAASSTSGRNPAAILAGEAVSSPAGADALSYQVQAGAYGSQTEAEQQRAKLGLMGLEAHLQEREVNGRTMYRVRLGPFGQREQAEDVRVKLQAAGIESALVRVQK